MLVWTGDHWYVRDLGSTNGTHVDGYRLAVGERLQLQAGAALVFGDEAEHWVLEDAGPPIASARTETGEMRRAEDGLLPLPDAGDPLITLFENRHGRWIVDAGGTAREAIDQEVLEAGGQWTLSVPPAGGDGRVATTHRLGTEMPKLVETIVLRFEVSRDGEYIELSIVQGTTVTVLGARAHYETVLALAQARLRDKKGGVPPAEQGWLYVDDLLVMLKLDLQHFNVNIFRARQNIARAGVIDVGSLFERRSTTRQIRLGTDAVEVLTV